MAYFNWREEDINNSNLNDSTKNILLAEVNGKYDINDPSIYDKKNISFWQFKKMFYNEVKYLNEVAPTLFKYTMDLHQKFPYEGLANYIFRKEYNYPDKLISYVFEFFAYLGDKDLYQAVYNMFINDYSKIKIQKSRQNHHLANNIRGRVILDQDVYLSVFLNDTIEDFTTLIHEITHYLSNTVYKDQINPVFKHFLTEFESKFFELLAIRFIGERLHAIENSLALEANEVAYIVNTIWNIKIQELIYKQIGFKFSSDRINKQLAKIPGSIPIKEDEYPKIVSHSLSAQVRNINSFLMALEFYDRSKTDLKEALKDYKAFVTSNITDINHLCNEHKINYLEDGANTFNNYVLLAKELANTLKS